MTAFNPMTPHEIARVSVAVQKRLSQYGLTGSVYRIGMHTYQALVWPEGQSGTNGAIWMGASTDPRSAFDFAITNYRDNRPAPFALEPMTPKEMADAFESVQIDLDYYHLYGAIYRISPTTYQAHVWPRSSAPGRGPTWLGMSDEPNKAFRYAVENYRLSLNGKPIESNELMDAREALSRAYTKLKGQGLTGEIIYQQDEAGKNYKVTLTHTSGTVIVHVADDPYAAVDEALERWRHVRRGNPFGVTHSTLESMWEVVKGIPGINYEYYRHRLIDALEDDGFEIYPREGDYYDRHPS